MDFIIIQSLVIIFLLFKIYPLYKYYNAHQKLNQWLDKEKRINKLLYKYETTR